jgi:hypothetical protein
MRLKNFYIIVKNQNSWKEEFDFCCMFRHLYQGTVLFEYRSSLKIKDIFVGSHSAKIKIPFLVI